MKYRLISYTRGNYSGAAVLDSAAEEALLSGVAVAQGVLVQVDELVDAGVGPEHRPLSFSSGGRRPRLAISRALHVSSQCLLRHLPAPAGCCSYIEKERLEVLVHRSHNEGCNAVHVDKACFLCLLRSERNECSVDLRLNSDMRRGNWQDGYVMRTTVKVAKDPSIDSSAKAKNKSKHKGTNK